MPHHFGTLTHLTLRSDTHGLTRPHHTAPWLAWRISLVQVTAQLCDGETTVEGARSPTWGSSRVLAIPSLSADPSKFPSQVYRGHLRNRPL